MARGQKAAPRSSWGDERKKNQSAWQKEHRTKLAADVSRETAELFRDYCKEHGTTVSGILSDYIYSLIGGPGDQTADDRRGDDQESAPEIGGGDRIDQSGPATASQRDQETAGDDPAPGSRRSGTSSQFYQNAAPDQPEDDTPGAVGGPDFSAE